MPTKFVRSVVTSSALLGMLATPALAQQTGAPQKTPQTTATITNSKPAPAPKRRSNSVQGLSDYWTHNYDASAQNGVQSRQADVRIRNDGRVPLADGNGTIGFTSLTANSSTLANGERIPAINPNTRSESSAVGFSISMPTRDNALLAPVALPWNRTE
jgi:hypothetical protein